MKQSSLPSFMKSMQKVAVACAIGIWMEWSGAGVCMAQVPVAASVTVGSPGASVTVAVEAPAPPPPPVVVVAEVPPPPAPEINFQYFHDQLAPWGTWLEVPGLGPVWKPADAVIAASPEWRPYYDNGKWIQTENGLFWQSDYTWGDIPFHYGRWVMNPVYGWVWVPDYTWGPAWVFWRHAEDDGAVGWAPLPPGAVFVDGGFVFRGAHVGVDFDFGLGEDCFVFVEGGHFHERFFRLRGREWHYHVDHARLHGFYGHSVLRNDFRRDEHGRFVNNGIGHDRMEHMNNHVEKAGFEERHPVGDREHAAPAHAEPKGPADVAGHAGGPAAGGNHPEAGVAAGASHPAGGAAAGVAGGAAHPAGGAAAGAAGAAAHTGAGGSSAGKVNQVFRPPAPAASASKATAQPAQPAKKK